MNIELPGSLLALTLFGWLQASTFVSSEEVSTPRLTLDFEVILPEDYRLIRARLDGNRILTHGLPVSGTGPGIFQVHRSSAEGLVQEFEVSSSELGAGLFGTGASFELDGTRLLLGDELVGSLALFRREADGWILAGQMRGRARISGRLDHGSLLLRQEEPESRNRFRAHVLRDSGPGWRFETTLETPLERVSWWNTSQVYDADGHRVAMAGPGTLGDRAVHVYRRSPGRGWNQEAELVPDALRGLGRNASDVGSLSLSDRLLAFGVLDTLTFRTTIYLFELRESGWEQVRALPSEEGIHTRVVGLSDRLLALESSDGFERWTNVYRRNDRWNSPVVLMANSGRHVVDAHVDGDRALGIDHDPDSPENGKLTVYRWRQ